MVFRKKAFYKTIIPYRYYLSGNKSFAVCVSHMWWVSDSPEAEKPAGFRSAKRLDVQIIDKQANSTKCFL